MIINSLIVSVGILVYCLILIMFSTYGTRYDAIHKRLISVANISYKGITQDEELNKPLSERLIKPIIKGFLQRIKKYIPEEKSGSHSSQNQQASKLKKMLRQAGLKVNVNEYSWIRLFVLLGTAIFLGMIALLFKLGVMSGLFMSLFGVYAAYAVFRFHLTLRISKRRSSMERQIPEVLDMLSISVEAGLGLEQAMIYVVNNFEGPLIDEISVSNREMSMGRSRREALLILGDRCEIEEMKSFVRAIVQAGEMGISIKNVLRSQASFMRLSRRNKIEEKAMQISVKILIPMVLFIFPVIFIVLLGPAVVNIMKVF